MQAHRDVLLVGGLRVTQREHLAAAGIDDDRRARGIRLPGPGMCSTPHSTSFAQQARLQLRAEAAQLEADAAGTRSPDDPPLPPPVAVREARVLAAIPEPSPGDLFFDFEGDPLYTEGDGTRWNLDYLFGMVDTSSTYTAFWAHSFAEEREALLQFLELVKLRRAVQPDLHIYHYASYERTHLTSIASRHGVGEADVDQLLADGVLVDLYPIVKRAVRVGSRSYSIKKLEPLYMGTDLREADVKSGGDSITEYVRARELAESGRPEAEVEAQAILADLAEYNEYDCVSTLKLRDWLLGLARREGVPSVPMSFLVEQAEGKVYEPSPLATHLRELAGPVDVARDSDHTALALAAAAIDYHARESKSFWWSHFLRTDQPVEAWHDHRDVLVVDPPASRETQAWHTEERWGNARRELLLSGDIAPGSRFSPGSDVFLLYEWPAPFPSSTRRPGQRDTTEAVILEVTETGVVVEERGVASETWSALPMAITPGRPPNTEALRTAIAEWAAPIPSLQPTLPLNPAMDVLRRLPPRSAGGLVPQQSVDGYVDAVVASVRRLEDSYLAVQGPPGTGKTYVASHVIARLVAEHGWRVGVVAQSHAVVENVLDAIIDAGLGKERVGKAVKDPSDVERFTFTALARKDHLRRFADEHASHGYVIGGTAWDFCNTKRVARGELDLLVIDEAGQFSLASTIAVSLAARNLLLLGDPQQLPQVSQALHPEPVDTSALGWVADGHDVLPPDYGYFLAESRRMHPDVAEPVSRLSYENALHSHRITSARHLDGVASGLTAVPTTHVGNSTASTEESDVVVELVRGLLGRAWSDAVETAEGPMPVIARPLTQTDLIVVTPYNAQLATVRSALDAAGFIDVPVGTVDKFQGQEAVVSIVSLAASSADDVPRGLEFLLLKNRLNVAISRAKWAAYLVYSPALLDGLPRRAEGVAQLSAFMRLVGAELPARIGA